MRENETDIVSFTKNTRSLTMFRLIVLTACIAVIAATGFGATTTNIAIGPSDSFWEGTEATPSSDYAPGWEPDSFQAPGAYSKYGFDPETLFGRPVTIGELQRITYWTKKDTAHTEDAADWFYQMYTDPFDGSPGSSWYGYRINSEPYFSANLSETAGTWTQWQTDEGQPNRLRFFDSSSGYLGSYTDGFLQDLTSDATYANEEIMIIDVGLGTAWAEDFDGHIDGLSIELTTGDMANINFVPEPATMGLLGLGGLGILIRRRRAYAGCG
ncbi:MAG: PEP-CTERM sorting domain-containing protein [Phycisphaerae bacterium]